MKKLLAVVAVAVLSGAFANAEDKGTEFKFGGEVRQRYMYDNNSTFLASSALSEASFLQRNQFHVNAISSDKLQAYFNFLHYAIWGTTGSAAPFITSTGTPNAAGVTTVNAVQLHEAWLWWKVSDMFSLRSGRQVLNYGDGIIFSKSDWLANPVNFEGIIGRFGWDFLDLDLGGLKLGEVGVPSATTITAAGSTAGVNNTDTEVNAYLAHASIKNLPEVIKTVDLMVLQLVGDAGSNGGTAAPAVGSIAGAGGWGLTNYGFHLKGDVAIIDYRADAMFQSGKVKALASTGTDTTIGGTMFDVQVGVNFPEFMKGRVFVGYHQDTGDDATTTDKIEAYQPLWYDVHNYAGMMNVFGFGNLTDINFGLTVKPGEDTEVGIEGSLLSRTTEKSAPTIFTAANNNMFTTPGGTSPNTFATTANTEKSLGTEIDVWAKHNYGHGFSILGQFGYLMAGNYFTPTGNTAVSTAIGKNAMQFVAQGQYNF